MKRGNPKARPSKGACDAYRRLMGDDISRLEKGAIDLETLPAIDLDSLPELDLEPPAIDLPHDTEEEGER
ncbi:hypothetical protein [Halomonas saccharevitans]|uniref:Uncharacterized protein n=1 Tax=Halomonas saccharevitans TaxID=416872 RepID=A0A1I6YDL2_9GAMM|nr:hypothetical protein [Halomonas saccharevitans]SFT48284.1 hypothetical protein SAMN04487956_10514 [Halomonas saccharevitans]